MTGSAPACGATGFTRVSARSAAPLVLPCSAVRAARTACVPPGAHPGVSALVTAAARLPVSSLRTQSRSVTDCMGTLYHHRKLRLSPVGTSVMLAQDTALRNYAPATSSGSTRIRGPVCVHYSACFLHSNKMLRPVERSADGGRYVFGGTSGSGGAAQNACRGVAAHPGYLATAACIPGCG